MSEKDWVLLKTDIGIKPATLIVVCREINASACVWFARKVCEVKK